MLTVKLTSSSSIDPQDAGLQPVVNPPCWASKTAVSFNLTIPSGTRSGAPYDIFVTDDLFAEQSEPPLDAVSVGTCTPAC